QWLLMGILMISALLNIAYLLPIPVRGFFASVPDDKHAGIQEAPWPSLIALSVTALGCIVLFLFPEPLHELAAAVLK
ncbi:MAG TPA: monovalent cation/H+ antiporter subunit D family protein, partial [Gammaproteobacteria bacterium]